MNYQNILHVHWFHYLFIIDTSILKPIISNHLRRCHQSTARNYLQYFFHIKSFNLLYQRKIENLEKQRSQFEIFNLEIIDCL